MIRQLIVNADDFGQSEGINLGVIRAFEQGILTSASLMVRWTTACEAAQYALHNSKLSVGLHVDLGEWFMKDGNWFSRYEVVDVSDYSAVADEIQSQLDKFQRLVRRPPTHMDSHQHVHRSEPVRSVLIEAADKLGIPLRSLSDRIKYVGSFYGQTEAGLSVPERIGPKALRKIIQDLPAELCELACHPAAKIDFNSMYSQERLVELKTLCDSSIKSLIGSLPIQLISFSFGH